MPNKSRKLFILLWLVFFIIFCVLGVWQIKRYYFKKTLIASAYKNMNSPPASFAKISSGEIKPVAFQAVKMFGVYKNNNIFIQNKLKNHHVGVEIFTPLSILGSKKLLLVDRGWVAWPSFKTVPKIFPVVGKQLIMGNLAFIDQYQFILGDNIQSFNKGSLVIQKINMAEISRALNASFYPFVLRLNANISHGFARDWSIASLVTVSPERHLGYALQWFLMALVLFVSCLFYFIRDGSNAKK